MKMFTTRCYNVYVDSVESEYCTSFSPNENNSLIISGGANDTNYHNTKYIGDLFFGANFKNGGEVRFKYKKDTIKDYNTNNGEFHFFVDYEAVIHDNDFNSSFITCKI
jgi:hypothetical protein